MGGVGVERGKRGGEGEEGRQTVVSETEKWGYRG